MPDSAPGPRPSPSQGRSRGVQGRDERPLTFTAPLRSAVRYIAARCHPNVGGLLCERVL